MLMHVAIHVTQGFLRYSYVMLQSLFESDPDVRFHVHVFSGNIEEADLADMRKMAASFYAEIHLYSVPEDRIRRVFHSSLPQHPVAMHTAYFMYALLPLEVDRIITLQCDMIVKGSFRALYEMDFEDAYAISINGDCIWKLPGSGGEDYFVNTFGKLDVAFYSEVNVLLNVEAIRRDFTFEDIKRADAHVVELFGRSNEEWAFALLFRNHIKYVSERIYAFYCTDVNAGLYAGQDILPAMERAVAIHYFTYKPWDSAYDIQHSYWWRVAKRTPYADQFLMEAQKASKRSCVQMMWQEPIMEMFLDEVVGNVGFLKGKRILLMGHLPKIAMLIQRLPDWNFVGLYRKGAHGGKDNLCNLPVLSAEAASKQVDVVLCIVRRCFFEDKKKEVSETPILRDIPAYFWTGETMV